MKKIYSSPVIKVVNIESEQLICDSQKLFNTSATEGNDLAKDRLDFDDEEDLW